MSGPPLSLSLNLDWPSTSEPDPVVRVTVKNTSKDETYTIFKWASPLDPLALALGLVSVFIPSREDGPGTRFDIPQIMLKRAMPPPEDAFVTLAPGEGAFHDIVLRDPAVDMNRLVSAAKEASRNGPAAVNIQVLCSADNEDEDEAQRGAVIWRGKRKEDLSDGEILSLGRGGRENGGAARWNFESNVLGLVVAL
ncbi:hypothetical protein QBC37DRAFT_451271 [Rhypophila decipiens]|uniref:Uncharacterized protein n=1 Tax=Rhypophila decipiens TaxID=261697 RepID=A0AAN6XYU7_9PEZI|nr:hypothetical protein QBC37DRAFT_451271 [Rhypophila decipiens]